MTKCLRIPVFLCTFFLISCLFLFPLSSAGRAGAEEGIKVKINDKFLSLSQPPIQVGVTTLLPSAHL